MASMLGLALVFAASLAIAHAKVPAVFYFGDSIFDTGNNKYIPGTPVNFKWPPYGTSYFGGPAGRFSNGRVIPDLIWQKLGFPGFPPPILEPGANFSYGANFASGGATCLGIAPTNGWYINLDDQLVLFKNLMKVQNSSAPTAEAYQKALYAINIGGNDVVPYLTNQTYAAIFSSVDDFATRFSTHTVKFIKDLYSLGARKIWFNMLIAVNCSPLIRNHFAWNSSTCVPEATAVVKKINEILIRSIEKLRTELPDAVIAMSNPHSIIKSSENPEPYGFLVGNTACCGTGLFNGQPNIVCGLPGASTTVCTDPEQYVFWDYLHGTERTYRTYADRVWSGPRTDIHPTNLHTLVNLDLKQARPFSSSKHGDTCDFALDSSCQKATVV